MFPVVIREGAGGGQVPGEAGFGVEAEVAGEEEFGAGAADYGELERMLADGCAVACHAVDGHNASAGQKFGFASEIQI